MNVKERKNEYIGIDDIKLESPLIERINSLITFLGKVKKIRLERQYSGEQ